MNYTDPRSNLKGARPTHLDTGDRKRLNILSPRFALIGVGVLLVAGYLVFGQGGEGAGQGAGGQRGAGPGGGRGGNQIAPPVEVGKVEVHDIPIMANTIGTVLPNATVAVKSQIEGPLLSASFREGQLVKRGDVLFQIDPRPMEAALRQAEAQLARDQAQLVSAQSDAERAEMLAERGIVSTQQRDQIIATAKALTATQSANQAALERAQLNLSYTTIRAPIDGKTGPMLVHPGNLVRANDAAGMVVINQIQPVKISFSLPQVHLPSLQDRMREGDLTVSLTLHSESGEVVPADENNLNVKVDFIGNTVDEQTGTIELRSTFGNTDMRLVPGQLVDVGVHLDTLRNATVVPRTAVNIGQDGGTYVWVVGQDDVAQMHAVKMTYQDEQIAAIGDALQKDERVIINGQLRVTPGVRVAILDPNAGRAPAAGATPGAGAARQAGTARGPEAGEAGPGGAAAGGGNRRPQ